MSRSIIAGVQSLILGVLVVLMLACSHGGEHLHPPAAGQPQASADLVGKPAPPFRLAALHGKEVSLENYRGKLLLLYSFHPA